MKLLHIAFIPVMFSHWFGWVISLGYVFCLVGALFLSRLYLDHLYLHKVAIGVVLFVSFFVTINYFNLVAGINNSVVYSYLYYYLSLFILVAIVLLARPWKVIEIQKIASVIFWISFYSIAVEFLLVNFAGISKEYMPGIRYSPSYYGDFLGWHRPFGLTGQSSVNGGILLFSYLLLAEHKIASIKAVLALIVGALLTISGQATLSVLLVLGFLLFDRVDSRLAKMVLGVSFVLFMIFILLVEVHPKVSLEYVIYVLWEKADFAGTISILNDWQIFFGSLGLANREGLPSNEVYLNEFVRLYGLVFTILYWVFVWFLVRRARNRFSWFAGCFVASLHYPTIIYIEAQLPLALLYLSTLQDSIFDDQKNIQMDRKVKLEIIDIELKSDAI